MGMCKLGDEEVVHAASIFPDHQNHLGVLPKATGEGEKTRECLTDVQLLHNHLLH
jgi:hypothetical protein